MGDRVGDDFDGPPSIPETIDAANNGTNNRNKNENENEDSPVVQALNLALLSNQLREERVQLRLKHLRQLKDLAQLQRLKNLEDCSRNDQKRPRLDRKISPSLPGASKSESKQPQLDRPRHSEELVDRQSLSRPEESSQNNRNRPRHHRKITPSSSGTSDSDSKQPAKPTRNGPSEATASPESPSEDEERSVAGDQQEPATTPKIPDAVALISATKTPKTMIGIQQKLRMKNNMEKMREKIATAKKLFPRNNNNKNNNIKNGNDNRHKVLTNGSNGTRCGPRDWLTNGPSVVTGSVETQETDSKCSDDERSGGTHSEKDDHVQSFCNNDGTQKLHSEALVEL